MHDNGPNSQDGVAGGQFCNPCSAHLEPDCSGAELGYAVELPLPAARSCFRQSAVRSRFVLPRSAFDAHVPCPHSLVDVPPSAACRLALSSVISETPVTGRSTPKRTPCPECSRGDPTRSRTRRAARRRRDEPVRCDYCRGESGDEGWVDSRHPSVRVTVFVVQHCNGSVPTAHPQSVVAVNTARRCGSSCWSFFAHRSSDGSSQLRTVPCRAS